MTRIQQGILAAGAAAAGVTAALLLTGNGTTAPAPSNPHPKPTIAQARSYETTLAWSHPAPDTVAGYVLHWGYSPGIYHGSALSCPVV